MMIAFLIVCGLCADFLLGVLVGQMLRDDYYGDQLDEHLSPVTREIFWQREEDHR